jgi:hypothetical protein
MPRERTLYIPLISKTPEAPDFIPSRRELFLLHLCFFLVPCLAVYLGFRRMRPWPILPPGGKRGQASMVFDELKPHGWLREKMETAFFNMSRSCFTLSNSRLSWRSSSRGLMPTAGKRFGTMVAQLFAPLMDGRGSQCPTHEPLARSACHWSGPAALLCV